MLIELPLPRPVWVDTNAGGDEDDALTMALGIVIRMLAAYPTGAVKLQLADGTGQLSTAFGSSSGPNSVLAGPMARTETQCGALLAGLAERIDLVEMARSAGAVNSLPPEMRGRVLLVVAGLWPTAPDHLAMLQYLGQRGPAFGINLLVVGDHRDIGADDSFIRLPTSAGGFLTDGWVGLQWQFTPDLGPSDPELAAALLRRMA